MWPESSRLGGRNELIRSGSTQRSGQSPRSTQQSSSAGAISCGQQSLIGKSRHQRGNPSWHPLPCPTPTMFMSWLRPSPVTRTASSQRTSNTSTLKWCGYLTRESAEDPHGCWNFHPGQSQSTARNTASTSSLGANAADCWLVMQGRDTGRASLAGQGCHVAKMRFQRHVRPICRWRRHIPARVNPSSGLVVALIAPGCRLYSCRSR